MLKLRRVSKKFNFNIVEKTIKKEEYLVTEAAAIESISARSENNFAIVITSDTNIESVLDKISIIIICETKKLGEDVKNKFIKYGKPILYSHFKKRETISILDSYLLKKKQTPERVHGTLLTVFGSGVLIIGKSGIGKSELALELINRKHLFVGDDAIDVISFAGIPMGKAPKISRDFIEVRGVGIINIKGMFGIQSIIKESNIDLIIELVNLEDVKTSVNRLGKEYSKREINGIEIPLIQIPLSSGRSVAPVVEAAVIVFKQRISNEYIAVDDLTKRLNNEL
ncbi:MAG: hypothetical protein HRS50_00760 [Mycoplasmataceae bacterium]|nr:hypothetical protein [Mycoplasmataceae bacterium]